MNSERIWLAALPVVLVLAACSDSPRPYGDRTTTPPSSPAAKGETSPTMTPPANTAAPTPAAPGATLPPQAAEGVDEKKGSETGMVGGASGTAASGGKPGANMPGSGDAAQTTGEPTKSGK